MPLGDLLPKLQKAQKDQALSNSSLHYDFFGVFCQQSEDLEAAKLDPQLGTPAAERTFVGVVYTLVREGNELRWRRPKPGVAPPPVQLAFDNAGFEWLSYEAVLNKPRFRRTNQELKLQLYSLKLSQTEVWLRSHIEPAQLKVLADAFFPDIAGARVAEIVDSYWPWKNDVFKKNDRGWAQTPGADAPRSSQPAAKAAPGVPQASARSALAVYVAPRVVLPYNAYDNHRDSCALGTTELESAAQLLATKTWSFWKTASRSNVVKLERAKDAGAIWSGVQRASWEDWPFAQGQQQRTLVADTTLYTGEITGATALKVSDLTASHVSLKTGVCFVGSDDQSRSKIGSDGKDCIDDNWIVSCLRSDFVQGTLELMKRKGYRTAPGDDRLVVLTELLSVVELQPRIPTGYQRPVRDGVQVRDLSLLNKARKYVFPGSIPYLGTDNRQLAVDYASRGDAGWCDFWRKNWAAALGEAKALFLLRFGLQHINPNPQNYLIELDVDASGVSPALKGPSRIVIRDLQDAALHREVIWALYGDEKAPPPTAKNAASELAAAFRGRANRGVEGRQLHRLLQYEFESVAQYQETGSTDSKFGNPGARLAWWLFSAGTNEKKEGASGELQSAIGAQGVQEVFTLLSSWGLAHDAAYVSCIERELGVELRKLAWTRLPSQKIDDEEQLADSVQEFLRSPAGQDAIRAYRRNLWSPPAPRATWSFVASDDSPLAWRIIELKGKKGAPWFRVTDHDGNLPLYGTPALTAKLVTSGGRVALTQTGNTWKQP